MNIKPPYSKPKLIRYDDLKKTWYVYFRYNGKVVKQTGDINRIPNDKLRERAGNALAGMLHEKLKNGWNPFVPDITHTVCDTFTLYQALEFAMEKKKAVIADKTYKDYSCTLRFAKKAISELHLNYLMIADTKRAHIKLILEHMQKDRSWSNMSYNKNLGQLQAILSELIQWDIIPFSPGSKIKSKPVPVTRSNIPPTAPELKIIKQHMEVKHPEFLIFINMLFHTGIRPVELTRIKIGMIDVTNRIITLPAEITKTKKERIVPINDHLFETLIPYMKYDYPEYFYLFGSHRPSGKGNIGLHKDFMPGPTKMKRDTATKRWEKIVKIGLGIDRNLYSMKKAGANAKILAGMSTRALKELFGHTSELTTEIYITNLHEVINKEIMLKSPAM